MFDDWASIVAVLGALLGAYAAIVWLGIIVWTYRDIRVRTHDTWSQAVAVLLVVLFNIPGLFLYLILRPHETLSESYERRLETEMIRQEFTENHRQCPSCQLAVQEDFLICPNCRTTLQEPCAVCDRPLSLEWVACPYCGGQGPKMGRDARVASVRQAIATAAPTAAVPGHTPAPPTPAQSPTQASQPEPSRASGQRSVGAKPQSGRAQRAADRRKPPASGAPQQSNPPSSPQTDPTS